MFRHACSSGIAHFKPRPPWCAPCSTSVSQLVGHALLEPDHVTRRCDGTRVTPSSRIARATASSAHWHARAPRARMHTRTARLRCHIMTHLGIDRSIDSGIEVLRAYQTTRVQYIAGSKASLSDKWTTQHPRGPFENSARASAHAPSLFLHASRRVAPLPSPAQAASKRAITCCPIIAPCCPRTTLPLRCCASRRTPPRRTARRRALARAPLAWSPSPRCVCPFAARCGAAGQVASFFFLMRRGCACAGGA